MYVIILISDIVDMKYFYEDILREIGEFGPWQWKRLAILWIIMLVCGTQFIIIDVLLLKPNEFACKSRNVNCTTYRNFFANDSTIRLKTKVRDWGYDCVFPKLMEHNQLSLNYIEEMYMSFAFCEIFDPEVDENGECYWATEKKDFKERGIDNENGQCNWNKKERGIYKCRSKLFDEYIFNVNETVKLRHSGKHLYKAKHGLLCEDFEERVLIQFALALGSLVGCIIILSVSNRFGRRWGLFLSILGVCLGSLILVAVHFHHLGYYVGVFSINFGKWSMLYLCYLYLVEIAGLRKRVFSRIEFFTYHSFVGLSLYLPFLFGKLLAGLLFHWGFGSYVHIFGSLSAIPIFLLPFLKEPPRYLLSKFKFEEAKEVMKAIAKDNNREEEIDIKAIDVEVKNKIDLDGGEIVKIVEVSFGGKKETVHLELRHYKLRILFSNEAIVFTIALIINWIMATFMRISTNHIGNFTIETEYYFRRGLEIGGVLLTMFLEGIIGRRRCYLLYMSLVATLLLFSRVLDEAHENVVPYYWKNEIERFTEHFLSFFGSGIQALLIWYTLCVFPASKRPTIFGVFVCFAGVAELLAPIVLELYIVESTANKDFQNPYFWMAVGYYIAALAAFYLPEILSRPTPDTLDDVMFLRLRSKVNYSDQYYYSKIIYVR